MEQEAPEADQRRSARRDEGSLVLLPRGLGGVEERNNRRRGGGRWRRSSGSGTGDLLLPGISLKNLRFNRNLKETIEGIITRTDCSKGRRQDLTKFLIT